jgi:hypothetical protein
MESNWVIWDSKKVLNACSLYELLGVDKLYQLTKGIPRAATFTENAVYTMDSDFLHDTLLTDNLINSDMLIVGSLKLKKFFEARSVQKVEYLPVTILDHKQKPASRDYFIIHPIEPVDCLDLDKCDLEWGIIDENSIDKVNHLVIDESRISPERKIFRPNLFYDIVLVHRELADEIDAEGFTGIRWIELSDYPEF